MVELDNDGFESGDFSGWDGTSGAPTVVDTQQHHGTYSMYIDGEEYAYFSYAHDTYYTVYTRFYIMFTALPGNGDDCNLLTFYDDWDGVWCAYLYLEGSGTDVILKCSKSDWSDCSDTYTWNPATSTWYCVEIAYYSHASAGFIKVWVDGTLRIDETGIDTSDGVVDTVRVGTVWRNGYSNQNYYDCVVVDEDRITCEAAGGVPIGAISSHLLTHIHKKIRGG